MNPDAFYESVVEKTANYINPYLTRLLSFAGFGVEVMAEGCYIHDHEGKAYLDCLGGYGVFSLGHRHPKVVQAVKDQLDKMPLGGKTFFNSVAADLAEALAQRAPGELQYTFFCNSGAEAVEAALKLARVATGRTEFVSTEGGYHGKTFGALTVTGREKYQKPFQPLLSGTTFVPYGDTESAVNAISDTTAAFIVEVVQGEGGIVVPSDGYLPRIQSRCKEVGALFIVDEVQTGFGRTGTLFASEYEALAPDLMTLAKCLGGGVMPIGACMGTPEVWELAFSKNPLLHTSTFGGNELACAAGLAALRVIEEEDLCTKSRVMGERMRAGLREAAQKCPDLVKEVRGRGLMIGVELAMDEIGELLVAQMLKNGMVVAYTLNNPRVIRFEPPLTISESQVDQACEIFGLSLIETQELLAVYS